MQTFIFEGRSITFMKSATVVGIVAVVLILSSVIYFMEISTVHNSSQTNTVKPIVITTPSSTLLPTVAQAGSATGQNGYVVGAWVEVSNLSGLLPTNTTPGMLVQNLSKNFGTTYLEVLSNKNSTAVSLLSTVTSPNATAYFRKLALILVAGYNFNVNKSGELEYVYGNISSTGLALGYDGKYLVADLVKGTSNPAQSALNLLMIQYQDVLNSRPPTPSPTSIFPQEQGMRMVSWAYVNYTALRGVNLTQSLYNNLGKYANGLRHYESAMHQPAINLTLAYAAVYANSTSLLSVQVAEFNSSQQAQSRYQSALNFFQSYVNYTGHSAIVSTGQLDGSTYFVANPNPLNNNTLILYAVSGNYLVTELNFAKAASQSLLLSYLGSLLQYL